MLPPVPKHEWDHLRDLALGKRSLDEFPQRRSRPIEEKAGEGDVALKYLQKRLTNEAAEVDGAIFDLKEGLKIQTKTQEDDLPPARCAPQTLCTHLVLDTYDVTGRSYKDVEYNMGLR